MKPCISEATLMPCTFAEDVAYLADAGCAGMEVWLTKLENHLQAQPLADTRKLLADRGMELAVAAFQGGLLLSQGEQRQAHFEHFRRRLDLCAALGIPTLIVAADFGDKVDAVALERAVVSLAQAAQWAAGFGVRLALEFFGRSAFCSSLDTALALVGNCGENNVGINFDVFHYYTGPSKFEDLERLPVERLFHVQLCDVAGVPRELAQDGDRILPGDGDFQLRPLVECIAAKGYEGWVSLEAANPALWQVKPTQVAEIGFTALRKMLGVAEARCAG